MTPNSSINGGQKFKISNEGQTVSNDERVYGTMRFGEFLSVSDIPRFKGKFKMDKTVDGQHGVGLITPEFDKFYINNDYNYGDNHSLIVYDSGGSLYIVSSDEFNNCQDKNGKKKSLTPNECIVSVEIDMIQKIVKFENDKNEIYKMKNIPECVALVFSFGVSAQKVTCISQEFY